MNSILKTAIRSIAFLATLLIVTLSASADQPSKTSYSTIISHVDEEIAPFPIHVEAAIEFTETLFFRQDGSLSKILIHQTEQDTFSANGKTLVSLPYTFNVEITFDKEGNLKGFTASGVMIRVPLPDGSVFLSAGRVDLLDGSFGLLPDAGRSGNLEGFIAALAP